MDDLAAVAAWAQIVLATVAVGGVLYFARGLLQPVVTAIVVGVMLSPAVRWIERLRAPRIVAAAILVSSVAALFGLLVAFVSAPLADLTQRLPAVLAILKDKFDFAELASSWAHFLTSIGIDPATVRIPIPEPSFDWLPSTIGFLSPTITGFLYFLLVLLLFLLNWPEVRKALVATFAGRESQKSALKFLNEVEDALASYLITLTAINLCVGALTGVVCAASGMPTPVGFGALAALLNFIPIIGPLATLTTLAVVGVLAAPTLASGLVGASGFLIITTLEGQVVTPAIIGRRLAINTLAVMLSFMFWTWIWGPMGAFLASPLLIVGLIARQHLREDGGGVRT